MKKATVLKIDEVRGNELLTTNEVKIAVVLESEQMLLGAVGTALAVRAMQALGAQPLRNAPYPGGLSTERLRRVVDYIEANIGGPILLTELANIAALSTFHFSRAFKKAMNIPPVRYVWHRRVEHAKRRLRDKTAPLAWIAYECGFSSQSHFTTMFKSATGTTPRQWRQSSSSG